MFRITLAAALGLISTTALAQTPGPRFEVDAAWPKPLPENWIHGQLGGVCVDSHDHILVVDRRNILDEEAEIAEPAPPIIMFDLEGNVVAAWGDPEAVPNGIHGCTFDTDDNVWIAGNRDGIIQKYSHSGDLLMQIGTHGVVDTSDGTGNGTARNASHEGFFNPAGVAVDPENGDLYVADGYGNRRVAVFDASGKYLRQWGRQATAAQAQQGEAGAFSQVLHCVVLSNAGLVYVCDRQGDRIQVFDKSGRFVRNIWVRTGAAQLPDATGTAWWMAFSPDAEQRYIYVMNGRNEVVHVLDHESGDLLSSFGRPGHQAGHFTNGHTLAVDSHNSIYVAETSSGRRVQRFRAVR